MNLPLKRRFSVKTITITIAFAKPCTVCGHACLFVLEATLLWEHSNKNQMLVALGVLFTVWAEGFALIKP
jgi:hypothetical protein